MTKRHALWVFFTAYVFFPFCSVAGFPNLGVFFLISFNILVLLGPYIPLPTLKGRAVV